jgi:hypothetical protein
VTAEKRSQNAKLRKKHDVFLQQSQFLPLCVTQITKIKA